MSYYYTFFLGKKYADGTIDYLGEEPIIISRYSEYVLSENFMYYTTFSRVCQYSNEHFQENVENQIW